MADPKRRLAHNAPGDFFVDASCIDCDTCRWMAPATFTRREDQASVHAQPRDDAGRHDALLALLSCPTGSIGSADGAARADLAAARAALPQPVDGEVYHCGYHHEASFGAASYLLRRPPDGNVLVDSPRFTRPLVKRLEELGGVARMFLTHRDDVADHQQFHDHFGCERVLHQDDLSADTRGVERVVDGTEPVALAADLTAIPVPGHTAGSMCLHFADRYLFSGDHVAWSERLGHVYAFRSACWYDWDVPIRSMRRLEQHRFAWILPGHGRRCHIPEAEMPNAIERCARWMET